MSDHHILKPTFVSRGIQLNQLKDQLHSLHMLMLLAVQNNDTEAQEDITAQIAEVQGEIDRITFGGRHGAVP